jgi:FAD binding domain
MALDVDIAGLEGGLVRLASQRIEELDSRLEGNVLRPGAAGWEEAVQIWNGMVAKVPALVLQPASAHDVSEAVRFARDSGLLLSIKGGGHNIAGTSIAENGLALDMSLLRSVTVDSDTKLGTRGPRVSAGRR